MVGLLYLYINLLKIYGLIILFKAFFKFVIDRGFIVRIICVCVLYVIGWFCVRLCKVLFCLSGVKYLVFKV